MAEAHDREHFIPFRKADVVQMCVRDGRLEGADRRAFLEFARILEAVFHFEFHQRLEGLKNSYASFDPDADTRGIVEHDGAARAEAQTQLVAGLREVLERGNYRQIASDELERAMDEESLFRIRLYVDFDDFEEVLFFRRGETRRSETIKEWFGLRKREIDVTLYERVAIYVKFKGEDYFAERKRKNLMFKPGSTLLKLFRNIPKADLEMLFPNTEVRMKPIDKVVMGVPAVASGIIVIVTKLGAVLSLIVAFLLFWLGLRDEEPAIQAGGLIAIGAGFAALAGFLFKQWNTYKNRKIKFMKALTDNLYFKNLDNNAGVLHHLVDAAEEEECKEVLLGYYFLLTSPQQATDAEIDERIEAWFREHWDCDVDFEVGDALHKLERLGLVEQHGRGWRAKPLPAALEQLDAIWDRYFTWAGGEGTEANVEAQRGREVDLHLRHPGGSCGH